MNWQKTETLLIDKVVRSSNSCDPAHDVLHFKRVVQTARRLAGEEGGRLEIVLPAAWLHDLVWVQKSDPRRSQASRLSAQAALEFLSQIGYPAEFHAEIAHAIEAHSFSGGIEPQTLEAKIVQDADRLDAVGAVGIARCFATAGLLSRPLYSDDDPFCQERKPDDLKFTIDHFFVKLLNLADRLQTESGRREGHRRLLTMRGFLDEFRYEIEQTQL